MSELIARGSAPDHPILWQQTLPEGESRTLGRWREELRCQWWVRDPANYVSSLQAHVTWRDGLLHVRCDPDATNPIAYRGQLYGGKHRLPDAPTQFEMHTGEHFIIGQFRFELADAPSELSLTRQQLRELPHEDASGRIEVLARLPDAIRHAPGDDDLNNHVARVLIDGIPTATFAAVVRLPPGSSDPQEVQVLTAVRPGGGPASDFLPSQKLVERAVCECLRPVHHRWPSAAPTDELEADPPTRMPGCDWAMCVPLLDDPTPNWALYVAGRSDDLLRGHNSAPASGAGSDLKFAQLVADIFSSLRQVRDLQRRHSVLIRFQSRAVLEELMRCDDLDALLARRTVEVTVLFCDLRGSCLTAEQGQDDLHALWDRVSAALQIMTGCINAERGVIGDFQGDAAMGFWGWPLAVGDQAERAAKAARQIDLGFLVGGNPLLKNFNCGIGIASGQAVAGKLGTFDQYKVGVFGPVVNLASRLESMTKLFAVPILIDEATAERVRKAGFRTRRVAKVRPFGMTREVGLSQLLHDLAVPGALPDLHVRSYEAALRQFEAGEWSAARQMLNRLPRSDGPTQYLLGFMDRHGNKAPERWAGVIVLETK